MDIREIDYGIAFQVNDNGKKYIEVNKHLKEDPILYEKVLKHEIEHINSSNEYIDVIIDLKDMFFGKHGWRMFNFCLKYPRTFLCYAPVMIEKGKIAINLFMMVFWACFLFFAVAALYLMKLYFF